MSNEPITTVLSATKTYDLTDLPTVKDELSIAVAETGDDNWLGRAITQVSKAIANDVNRVFPPEYVQDVFNVTRGRFRVPDHRYALQLSRWPVVAVTSVIQTLSSGTTQILVENTDFRVDDATGAVWRLVPSTGAVTAWEALPTTVRYSAGYGAAVEESHAVPASGPYTVTVTSSATFSCDQTVTYANGTVLTPVIGAPAAGQYSVASGVYTFNAADHGQTLAFAYTTISIPDDLVDATLQLITARYRAKGRDPALVQQDTPGMGTQRFWFGGAPGQTGAFPPDIEGLLDNYRQPLVA